MTEESNPRTSPGNRRRAKIAEDAGLRNGSLLDDSAPPQAAPALSATDIAEIVKTTVAKEVANALSGERLSRNQEQRGAEPVHDEYSDMWEEPLSLDTRACPPRPGYHQRWVRTILDNAPDIQNVANRMNQGYQPRMGDTVPKGAMVQTVNWENFSNVIGIHGMILMEIPEEKHLRRQRAIQRATRDQMQAVDNDLMRDDENAHGIGGPRMTSRSTVTRGRPNVMSDP